MADAVNYLLNGVNKEVLENWSNYTQMWSQCDQWLDEVVKEAEKLFKKTDHNQTGCSEEADDSLPIILLPTTPGVKNIAAAREKRLRNKSSLPINRVSMKIRRSGIKFHHLGLNIPKAQHSSTPVSRAARVVVEEASEDEQDYDDKKNSIDSLKTPIRHPKVFQNIKDSPMDSKHKKGAINTSEDEQKSSSTPNPSPRRTRGSRAATTRKPPPIQDNLQTGNKRTTRSQAAKLSTLTSAVKSTSKLPRKRLNDNAPDSDDFEDEDTNRTPVIKIPKLKITSKHEVPASDPFGKTKSRSKITQHVSSPMLLQKQSTPVARGTPLNVRKLLIGKSTSRDDLQLKRDEELRQMESREKLAQLRKERTDKMKAEKAKLDREIRQQRFLDSKSKLQDKKRLEAEAKLKADKETEDQRLREEAERKKEALRKIKEDEDRKKEALRKVKEDEERRRKMQEAQRKELEEKRRQDELEKQKIRKIMEEEERRRHQAEEQRARQAEEARIRIENKKLEKLREIEEETNNKNSQPEKEDVNKTFSKDEKRADMNRTFTKLNETSSNGQSYEMTPSKEDLPPEPLKDDDNYDIRDLRSDEDTDDESKPRKVVPLWAQGESFRSALIKQAFQSPETVDHIFYVMDASIDLETIFAKKRSRFNKRTSSAVWGLPPLSHKY